MVLAVAVAGAVAGDSVWGAAKGKGPRAADVRKALAPRKSNGIAAGVSVCNDRQPLALGRFVEPLVQ